MSKFIEIYRTFGIILCIFLCRSDYLGHTGCILIRLVFIQVVDGTKGKKLDFEVKVTFAKGSCNFFKSFISR